MSRHAGFSRTARWWMTAAALVVAAGACAPRPRVVAPDANQPLAVPVIPQRAFAPLPEPPAEEPVTVEPEEPRPTPPRPTRPRPRPERAVEQKPEPSKPETTESAPSPTATPLRTPQIADDSETGRRIRATVDRAGAYLSRVNTASMSGDARMQFDTARRFIDQAHGALNARNYMFAAYLADKAEALARGLMGR